MSKRIPIAFIDFIKWRYVYFTISLLVIVPGLISLVLFGLKPSIDFTGGTLIELVNTPDKVISEEAIANSLPEGIVLASIQTTANNSVIVRTSPMDKDGNELFKAALASASGFLEASQSALISPASLIEEMRFETVGPTLGKELLQKTLVAIFLAAIMITTYVASRFSEIKYGVCAILAMFHDTLVLLGTFSLLGHFFGIEVDTLFVTAVLTTLSFSVHDTIVVYDRIRESRKLHPGVQFDELVNKAISETLTRSINNSMTIIFMLLALVLLGGESTRWFSLALLVGTITGTYSSTFTAAPLLVVWDNLIALKNKRKN